MFFGQYVSVQQHAGHENEAVKAAWSQVDIVLQRRADLIPEPGGDGEGIRQAGANGLWRYRQSTFRDAYGRNPAAEDRGQRAVGWSPRTPAGRVENYPQLKSNENFMRLQDELAGTENRIAVERQRYNDTLQDYNTYVQMFPNSIFAGWAGFKPNDAYFAAPEGSREVPKVNFNSPTTQAPTPEPAPAH